MRIMLLISFLLVFSGPGTSANTLTSDSLEVKDAYQLMYEFIKDIHDPEIALDVILSSHVHITQVEDQELLEYLLASLEEMRLNLTNRDLEQISFVPFNELPRKKKSEIDPEDLDPTKLYVMYHKDREMYGLYVDEQAIQSFTLVSKGNHQAHFVTY